MYRRVYQNEKFSFFINKKKKLHDTSKEYIIHFKHPPALETFLLSAYERQVCSEVYSLWRNCEINLQLSVATNYSFLKK
jgi:hypothetical protein